MPTWHWLDYLIVGIIGLSVITGLFRGFVKELIALCVWVFAIWLAFSYSAQIADWLQTYIHDKTARMVVAFIGILLTTLIVGAVFNGLLSFILHRSGLSGTDRVLGMGFGFVRGIFIVALFILAANVTALPYQEYAQQSALCSRFNPIVTWLNGFAPEVIKNMQALDKTEPAQTKVDVT